MANAPSVSGTVNASDSSIGGGGSERQRRGTSVGATAAPRPSLLPSAEGRSSRSTTAASRENSLQLSSRLRRAEARARSHLFWERATQRIHEEKMRQNSDRSAPEVVRKNMIH